MDSFRDGRWAVFEENRVYAFLSYLAFLCAIPLICSKDDQFVQHHARQGMVIFLLEFVSFLLTIILPVLLRPLLLVFGLLSLLGMLGALKGEKTELPLLHRLARRILF